jgi:hypothetical protein
MIASVYTTASDISSIHIYAYIDSDDIKTLRALDAILHETTILTPIVGPRIVVSKAWNACCANGSGDIVMLCADDMKFQSKGWDTAVEEVFGRSEDKILLVYGNDGYRPIDKMFPTLPFVSRKSTEILGKFLPPYFQWGYNDLWLNDIYEAVDRKVFLPDVVTWHYHFTHYPHYQDDTSHAMQQHKQEDDQIWEETREEREADIQKLRGSIQERLC